MYSMNDLVRALENILARAIREKIFPGCSLGIVLRNGSTQILSVGNYTYNTSSKFVAENSIYDVASLTKVIPTSLLALKYIDEKKISLHTKLIDHVPEYVGLYREEITLLHLLSQTLVFPFSLSSYKDKTANEILQCILHAQLKNKPGEIYCYTNTTSILLGLLLERVTGRKLDALGDEYFFKPFGMRQTTFHPEKLPKEIIVPTEIEKFGFSVQGIVHDESARVFAKEGIVVGSAGLFSTASDLLVFLKMLLDNGVHKKKKFFSEQTLSYMAKGIGWQVQKDWMGKYASESSFGKTGFTGCTLFCDRERGAGIVLLSNHTFPKRVANRNQMNTVRAAIIDSVLMHG